MLHTISAIGKLETKQMRDCCFFEKEKVLKELSFDIIWHANGYF